jgi:hypothetical protein
MQSMLQVQQLQLKLVESASVSENCAIDLMGILFQLTSAQATEVLGIIEVLLSEAESLKQLSRAVSASHLCA